MTEPDPRAVGPVREVSAAAAAAATAAISHDDWDLLFCAALEFLARVAADKAVCPGPGRRLQSPGMALGECLAALDLMRRSVPARASQKLSEVAHIACEVPCMGPVLVRATCKLGNPPCGDAVSGTDGPTKNQLLAALPAEETARWRQQLERVDLRLGQVLYESGSAQSHVYFPTTAIVSLLYVTENGQSAEIAVVGNEGVVGIALFMGGETTPNRAVVQSAGVGYRLTAQSIKTEFGQSAPVLHLLLRYTQALITQMAQTAVCNRHHSVDQQLCRWLLLSLDRLQSHELVMTQELIANMLGVRREGVTEAALKLQQAGLIRYTRGRIEVLDRPGLEQRTCECYAVVKAEYARLLPERMAS